MKTSKKTLFLFFTVSLLSFGMHAQQVEIEHNSGGNDPHIRLVEDSDPDDYSRIRFTNSTDPGLWTLAARNWTDDDFNIFYSPTGSGGINLMNIDGDDNLATFQSNMQFTDSVGIGTSSPIVPLDVRSGNALFSDGIGIGDLDIPDDNHGVRVEGKTVPLGIWTGSATARINWYNVAGGADATARASIGYQAVNGPQLELATNNASADISLESYDDISFWNGAPPLRSLNMFLDQDGDLGIGSSNPQTRLHISHRNNAELGGFRIENSSNGNWWKFYAQSGNNNMTLRNSTDPTIIRGTFAVNGTYTASDIRIKKNIEDVPYGLNEILKMNAKRYHYKSDKKEAKKSIGFMAQDIDKIAPELVLFDEEADQYSLNYGAINVIAVQAIQDQQEIISLQAADIHLLKSEMASLKAIVEALTAEK